MRHIGRLDVKNNALVKGINLEGLRVLGDPNLAAERYYSEGIQELFFMDVVASLYGRNSLLEVVKSVAEKVYVPLTVGGGIRSDDDISRLLNVGADKVAINTAFAAEPSFVDKVVGRFGSSTIVAVIEGIETSPGRLEAFTNNGREETGLDVIAWARELEQRGVGEIMYTDVSSEGTGNGGAYDFASKMVEQLTIPFVYHGGIGSKDHMRKWRKLPKLSGVCASSILHYFYRNEFKDIDASILGNSQYLKSNTCPKYITPCSVSDFNYYGGLNNK